MFQNFFGFAVFWFCWMMCDFYYIPQRFVNEMRSLMKIFHLSWFFLMLLGREFGWKKKLFKRSSLKTLHCKKHGMTLVNKLVSRRTTVCMASRRTDTHMWQRRWKIKCSSLQYLVGLYFNLESRPKVFWIHEKNWTL